MSSVEEEWPKNAIITQKNRHTYYSRFYLTKDHVIQKEYLCGSTLIVKIDHKVLIAQITHLWLFSSNNSEGHVQLKLFSLPDNLPHGRTHHHGEHEILMFHKPISLTCQQLISIEQEDYKWSVGVPLQPPLPVPSPQLIDPLYCNEVMVPVGGFHDETGASPASSPILSRCSRSPLCYRLRIISYPAYYRYRTVLKRFSPHSYDFMDYPLVQAMGGIPLPPVPTIAVFCRKLYRDMSLERKLTLLEEGMSLEELNDLCSSTEENTIQLRRKRGRPRKADQATYGTPLLPSTTTTITNNNSLTSRNNKVKRRRGRPRKYPPPNTVDPPIVVTPQLEPLQINVDALTNGDTPPDSAINKPHPLTSEVLTNGSIEIIFDDNFSPRSSGSSEENSRSLRPRDSLLPPPQFRDDSIYDTKLHLLSEVLSSKQENIQTVAPSPEKDAKKLILLHAKKQNNIHLKSPPEIKPVPLPQTTQIISPPSAPIYNTPLTPATPTPAPPTFVAPPTSAPPTSRAISPDVRQLLRAHLLKLQDNGLSESQAMLQNLDEHLLEEKPFLDLLFCFMKLRNTPIHKIPRLGSKYLNLYNLFHSTNRMGGYDQVTVNRKWSTVFDSMGCSAGMTCASTVTRKHYEKLLLPFEKALIAMRQATSNTTQ